MSQREAWRAPRVRSLYPELERYLTERAEEFDEIPAERKRSLERLATYIRARKEAGGRAKLIFICTHNSRRSHLAELWAAAAAEFFGVEGSESFSGGTGATAFDTRAVAALRRAGFRIERNTEEPNPHFEVSLGPTTPKRQAFSKEFAHPSNPQSGFAAVMTCSDADATCPIVPGAALRASIPYDDPKLADGTDHETRTYDERCRQISREMLYLFSVVTWSHKAATVP